MPQIDIEQGETCRSSDPLRLQAQKTCTTVHWQNPLLPVKGIRRINMSVQTSVSTSTNRKYSSVTR